MLVSLWTLSITVVRVYDYLRYGDFDYRFGREYYCDPTFIEEITKTFHRSLKC